MMFKDAPERVMKQKQQKKGNFGNLFPTHTWPENQKF